MLIRKINNINGQRRRISSFGIDPHGKLVCLYDYQSSQFILLEITSIYRHFENYRIDYIVNRCYDNKHRLPHLLIFKSEQILQTFPFVQFTELHEDSQCIIIHYCTFVEIIKFHHQNYEITFRVLYKLTTQILELSIIQQNLYLSMYDGSMYLISLHQIERKKKADACRMIAFITEGMKGEQIGMSQSLRLQENRAQGKKIWQTFSGKLMLNKRVISNEFEDNFDYENSFEEYLGKELNQRHPMKYEMSRCKEYIIGSSSGKIVAPNSVFTVKARWCDWAQVCEMGLKPQINQFWTAYQSYVRKESYNWGFIGSDNTSKRSSTPEKQRMSKNCDKILVSYYCSSQSSLIISWIIVDKTTRKKASNVISNRQGKEQTIDMVRYKSVEKVLIRVSYLKNSISDIRWIGLNQLLCIDKEFKLLFVEFDPEVLKE